MPHTIIGVVGAGTMGGGIAEAALAHDLPVILYDVAEEMLARARGRIAASLTRQVERRRMTAEQAEAALARLRLTTRLDDLASATLIIEAAPEDLALKRELFAQLDGRVPPHTILASNTSSLSISALAEATRRPERVVGMHFFNPAPVMPLVEVIAGGGSAPTAVAAAFEVARALGKTPVAARDTPGFIVNRIARPFYLEALRLLADGVAAAGEIDRIMRLAGGFRMGPFELLDLIGLDVNLAVTRSIYEAFARAPRFQPHPLQEQMVRDGLLGRKVGRGFYPYEQGGPEVAPTRPVHGITSAHLPPDWPRRVLIVGRGALAEQLQASLREKDVIVGSASEGADVHPETDVVIETLPDLDDKAQLFARLDQGRTPAAPCLSFVAGNSPGRIAEASRRPELITGFATLPPLTDRRLVEVLAGPRAGPAAVTAAQALWHRLDKETAVAGNIAGGVFPRIFAMIVNEAALALGDAVASAEDIDTALRLGANYPQGPLALADRMGPDLLLAVLEGLRGELGDERFRPAPLLRAVASGARHGSGRRRFHEEPHGTHG